MVEAGEERYVYGPVPSRRLGQSLGVDPVPFKTCNYSCVYCQLGRTQPLICERGRFLPADRLLAQVRQALDRLEETEVDYITVVGQGEPTLSLDLGYILQEISEMSSLPLAVITNGSLLSSPQVREELQWADVVIPSLDAAEPKLFRRINRPCPRMDIEKIIEGMAAFCRGFDGQVWVEVMLVEGLNDGEGPLHRLAEALSLIKPTRIQLNVPVRPPAESWVRVPGEASLRRAQRILGQAAEVVVPEASGFQFQKGEDLVEAILAIVRRHPMREDRLLEALGDYPVEQIQRTLDELTQSGLARRRVYRDQVFWESAKVKTGSWNK